MMDASLHSKTIQSIETTQDLLVIGGGIFGACVAMEASARGVKTLLVEQQDFGSGSSSNSLKIIHGGLRYLQSADFISCLISAGERKRWLRMIPELVRPLPCLLPTSRSLSKNSMVVGAGLLIYNLLTFNRNTGTSESHHIPNARLVSMDVIRKVAPEISAGKITGGALWYDAQAINTERLQMAILMKAQANGALIQNYCDFRHFKKSGDGYKACLSLGNDSRAELEVNTRYVLDCTGVGRALEKKLAANRNSHYVHAVNLVVKKRIADTALGIRAMDQSGISRLLFIVPWESNYSLLGTWYFERGEKSEPCVTKDQLQQCIDQVNLAFRTPQVNIEQVVQVHLGALPSDSGRLASRGVDNSLIKHAKLVDWSAHEPGYAGLYSLQGTKYTLADHAARQVLDKLAAKGLRQKPSTRQPGRLWPTNGEACDNFAAAGLDHDQIEFIKTYFSCGMKQISKLCLTNPELRSAVPGFPHCVAAVVVYCLLDEFTVRLTDLLARRLPLGNAELPPPETVDYCVNLMVDKFKWDDEREIREREDLKKHYLKGCSL